VITSKDGKRCGVTVQVDDHPGEPRPYVLNQIADSLRIDRRQIGDVLGTWSHEQLQEHLSHFTQQELRPVKLRNR
jgi:hypothetical protein